MSQVLKFWRPLVDCLERGERVFLALVAGNTRHSPGTVGARLWLSESGERAGTIGGGIMEFKLLERAREIMQRDDSGENLEVDDFMPRLQTLHHRKSFEPASAQDGSAIEVDRSGMICAGSQTNLCALCRPASDLSALRQLIACLDTGRAGTLLISPSGFVVEDSPPDLSRPAITLERDGEEWSYREQLLNRRRLAIFGGGHCALALARTLHGLGYDLFVYETREQVFEEELKRWAQEVRVVSDFREAGALVDFPELTYAVVMTTDFPSDVRALLGILPHPFPFIGVMGAPAKLEEIRKRLLEAGFSTEDLERLHAPVGLPIPTHTPEEIAISVAAQILSLRGSED